MPRRISLRVLAAGAAICIMGLFPLCRAAETPANPLLRRIDLDLREADLGVAVRQITSRGKVDVLVAPDVALPQEFPRHKLYLETRGLTVRQSAEWIARALGIRYRVLDGGRGIEFTSSYEFLDAVTPVTDFYNLGGVTTWENRSEFLGLLRELLKVHLVREPDYNLRIRAQDRRLQANLPPTLHSRLRQILGAMAAPGQAPARASKRPESGAAELLARPVRLVYSEWNLADILRDLAGQANTNIGFDHLPFAGRGLPALTLDLGKVPLARALAELCDRTELESATADPPAGIWLSAHAAAATGPGSRELLWEGVPVRGFAARPAAMRLGVDLLLGRVREAIPADYLADPSVSLAYHERSGNLIVVAPKDVLAVVESVLYNLMRVKARDGGDD